MNGVKDVTHATVGSVIDWLDGLEMAYEKFEKWLKKQKFSASERTVAQATFDIRFSSMSSRGMGMAQVAWQFIGDEQGKVIQGKVKKFAIDNGLATEAEWDSDD
jgi:hypothetical protein